MQKSWLTRPLLANYPRDNEYWTRAVRLFPCRRSSGQPPDPTEPMKNIRVFLSVILLLVGGPFSAVIAKGDWVQVRSENFVLIGNASAKDIRAIAERLERFRSTLDQVFKSDALRPRTETRVVVFRDEVSYTPFKPLRRDGTVDATVEGYFQSGQDVNYITLTVAHTSAEAYHTIFHEYVHTVVEAVYPGVEVPVWFNEGLAEYYSTFTLRGDSSAEIGLPIKDHVRLLEKNTVLPLNTLFRLRSSEINNSSVYSRALFYAESWALVHYLIDTEKKAQMDEFIKETLAGKPQDEAFRKAFGQDYSEMERIFDAYIRQKQFRTVRVESSNTDAVIETATLSEARANAYLGDLLYRVDRPAQAEPILLEVIKTDPSSGIANMDLGMIRFEQHRFDEARKYLGMAATPQQDNALVLYRYAYLLSLDGSDDPARAATIRGLLRRAIAAAPSLTDSYDLLASIDLATNAGLTDAAQAMRTALRYEPGRTDFALRLAEIYVRQEKYDSARELAERASRYSAGSLKQRADALLTSIDKLIQKR